MNKQTTELQKYRVRVGHTEVSVKARDIVEAITLARRKLGRELPRLYDVIRELTPAQFQVDEAA